MKNKLFANVHQGLGVFSSVLVSAAYHNIMCPFSLFYTHALSPDKSQACQTLSV